MRRQLLQGSGHTHSTLPRITIYIHTCRKCTRSQRTFQHHASLHGAKPCAEPYTYTVRKGDGGEEREKGGGGGGGEKGGGKVDLICTKTVLPKLSSLRGGGVLFSSYTASSSPCRWEACKRRDVSNTATVLYQQDNYWISQRQGSQSCDGHDRERRRKEKLVHTGLCDERGNSLTW